MAASTEEGDHTDDLKETPMIDHGVVEDSLITSTSSDEYPFHFDALTKPPMNLIFLFLLPIIWVVFIAVGFSQDDIVENEVSNIWIETRSSYIRDLDYSAEYDRDGPTASIFAAMAVSRDGKNLFTAERLEEVRARMEETELTTTVEYKGISYNWDDICLSNNAGKNTTYQFPCTRISPMDYFQEARWFFDDVDRNTWYEEIIEKLVIRPRIPRFGAMSNAPCGDLSDGNLTNNPCDQLLATRFQADEALKLFADIGNLEFNDACKICIEETYEGTIDDLYIAIQTMFVALLNLKQDDAVLVESYEQILSDLDHNAVVDFYTFYVIRTLYAQLGSEDYLNNYRALQSICELEAYTLPFCFLPNITEADAYVALLNHADHTFSSTVTSGNPIPIWGNDGEGLLLEGFPSEPLSPVSGSGIDMSGRLLSTLDYLANPNSTWQNVETDPVYRWFIAGVTDMTAHCGNGTLNGISDELGGSLAATINQTFAASTQHWCTEYNIPTFDDGKVRTQQHFARMWFGLLVDSPSFLGLTQGTSDPYTWTTGQGCGYTLGGVRFPYSSENEVNVLGNASGPLYYIDEGATLGPIDTSLLIGGTQPSTYSESNPLTKVSVVQMLYLALLPEDIVKRVANCNRPGGPVEITKDDAEEVLYRFKEAFEDTWTVGWDSNNAGQVQFVGFFDDAGVIGTTGRMLEEITLSGGTLTVISLALIALFSVAFLYNFDLVASKVTITLIGVLLVILAFFAAMGFGLLVGIKINITIAWTLPFIMLGLGVDDMYILILSLNEQKGISKQHFVAAMKEIFTPITMTSFINAGMFAIMNVNDIPAIYLTAQVALISVCFIYLTIIFSFPAWCWLDMSRQASGRHDLLFCKKTYSSAKTKENNNIPVFVFYEKIYRPLILGTPKVRALSHMIIFLAFGSLLGLGIWGMTETNIGLGLEDFFPSDNQASRWANVRTEDLASWSIAMNWGAINYTSPDTQMRMIKQFERIVESENVAQIDTKLLWMADFLVWTTRHCEENFSRENHALKECGSDQVFEDGTTCLALWTENIYKLREKVFEDLDTCTLFEGGICRPTNEMHPLDLEVVPDSSYNSWCPVIDNWSNEKFGFCIEKWREITGGSGNLVLLNETGTEVDGCVGEYNDDKSVLVPLPYSRGPSMFAINLYSHDITVDVIEETRKICDDDAEIHCWMTGVPYNYWSQYTNIQDVFLEISSIAIVTGFGIAFLFLFVVLQMETQYSIGKILFGSMTGAFLITAGTLSSLITVAGLSSLAGVNLTGFSSMSFVLSVGYSVEYSVHVVARWLRADSDLSSIERVEYTMSFLTVPMFMSFVSSAIGVSCLAFTEFEFNEKFFFRPLIILMAVTYFFGCWCIPVLLTYLNFDILKFGENLEDPENGHKKIEAA